jgi:hypothetical protein
MKNKNISVKLCLYFVFLYINCLRSCNICIKIDPKEVNKMEVNHLASVQNLLRSQ